MAWLKVSIIREQIDEVSDTYAKATRTYRCYSDAAISDSNTALTAGAGGVTVAARGEAFSGSRPFCNAIERTVERVPSGEAFAAKVIDVVVNYEDFSGGVAAEDLLLKPAIIDITYDRDVEEYTIDTAGIWVCSSSAEPFDKNPDRYNTMRVFNIQKYVTAAQIPTIEAALDTLNTANKTIKGLTCTARHGQLVLEGFKPITTTGAGVYLASYKVLDRKRPWDDDVIDQGYREATGGTGIFAWKDINNQDDSGAMVPVAKPWPLDGHGHALPASTSVADLVKLTFKPYYDSDWSGVPLT